MSYFGELLSHLTSYAEPSDAEPSDAESSDAEPSDAESSDAEPSDAESSDAEPTEAKNKLGYKIRTLFKNCNCAAGQELSGNHLFPSKL